MTGPRTPHRLFVALWPGPELTRSLEQELSPLRERAGANVVWQAPERLHLTLAFVGDRDPVRQRPRWRGSRPPTGRRGWWSRAGAGSVTPCGSV